jgi:hypothetical protein
VESVSKRVSHGLANLTAGSIKLSLDLFLKEAEMGRTRTGSIVYKDGSWYARIIFRDEAGKRREKLKRADSRSDARQKQRN